MYEEDKLVSVSEDIKSKMLSGDKDLIKRASLAADDYFRTEIRENGIRRNITPPVQVSDDMLDYVEDTDFPVMLAEIAPRSAGAVLVSFETGPGNEVIHGRKTRIEFNRVMTPKYSIDKIRLKGYHMPLLDILYDLMLKDIMDREDYITMAVEETVNGIKVKRVFEAYYYKSIRYERHFTEQHRVSWSEVMRIWTDPENPQNREVGTASLNLMNYSCRSPWAHSSSVVIRRPSSPGTNRYYIEQDYEGVEEIPVYCDRHIDISYQHTTLQAIQAELKGRIILHRCVERIFEVPMIESLVKAGRTKMAAFIANASFGKKYRYNHDARCTISVHLSDYITAAKICIRNDSVLPTFWQHTPYCSNVSAANTNANWHDSEPNVRNVTADGVRNLPVVMLNGVVLMLPKLQSVNVVPR